MKAVFCLAAILLSLVACNKPLSRKRENQASDMLPKAEAVTEDPKEILNEFIELFEEFGAMSEDEMLAFIEKNGGKEKAEEWFQSKFAKAEAVGGLDGDFEENLFVPLLEQKAAEGSGAAIFFLGVSKSEHSERFKCYKKAADAGFVLAYEAVADAYRYGRGVEKDEAEALKWYMKGAELGNSTARYQVGRAYFYGEGTEQDREEGIRWYRLAAEKKTWSPASLALADIYRFGKGVPIDFEEAEKHIFNAKEADDDGWRSHLYNLYSDASEAYENGDGVPKDLWKSVQWLKKAAKMGFIDAQNNLGVAYSKGEGVPEDDSEAAKWFQRAASRGNATAQYNLGNCYANGSGVPEDSVTAYKWFNLAAASGYEKAQEEKRKIERHMTREQIAEAQRLSREWKSE